MGELFVSSFRANFHFVSFAFQDKLRRRRHKTEVPIQVSYGNTFETVRQQSTRAQRIGVICRERDCVCLGINFRISTRGSLPASLFYTSWPASVGPIISKRRTVDCSESNPLSPRLESTVDRRIDASTRSSRTPNKNRAAEVSDRALSVQ